MSRIGIVSLCVAGVALLAMARVASPAIADETVTTHVRILGPSDEDEFPDTGDYVTIWSGEVEVPGDVTVTASSGRQYRLYVEDGVYKATRLAGEDIEERTWERGPGNNDLGATSVLAALHEACTEGGLDYELSDAWFPGLGLFLVGISDYRGHGTVGWNYRVDNGDIAPPPQRSVDRFLLEYSDSIPAPPHEEVLFYWGYGTGCRPLRIQAPDGPVLCGEPVEFTVQCFVDDGHTGDGVWEPLDGALVCSDGLCVETSSDGTATMAFDEPGTYSIAASAPHDGEYYYIPSEGVTSLDVEGPCRIISFTVEDHGEPGLDFGLVLRGTNDNAELAQSGANGAITLHVGAETTVDCELQFCGAADLGKDAGPGSLALSGFAWAATPDPGDSVPVTADYVTVGSSSAGIDAAVNLWHWLSVPVDQGPAAYAGEFRYRIVSSSS